MSALKKILFSTAVCILLVGLFAGFAYAESDKTATIAYDNVNIRETPDTSSKIVAKLDNGMKVTIMNTADNWSKISAGSYTGWVRNDLISTDTGNLGTGYVTENNLNIRKGPDASNESIGKLKQGDKVMLLEKSGDWFKVKTADGVFGWVSGEFISTRKPSISRGDDSTPARDETKDELATDIPENNADTVDKLITFAKKYLGRDYVYGGDAPKEGFDCSGFTKYVFSQFGVELERTAHDQSTQGIKVTRATLKAGDLLYFDTNGGHNRVNHAGIYIGNGKFIHASSGQDEIVISELNSGFYDTSFMKARRYIVKE